MAETININTNIAGETGRQILAEQGSIQEAFTTLRGSNEALASAWVGSAGAAFMESVNMLASDGDALAADLSIFGGIITQADLSFSETDQLNSAWLSGLGD